MLVECGEVGDEERLGRRDLNRPMDEILAELTKYPVKTRLSLTGPRRILPVPPFPRARIGFVLTLVSAGELVPPSRT
ncbi:hypothetical protein CLM82_25325, partial [Streptomyces albidoflavus]